MIVLLLNIWKEHDPHFNDIPLATWDRIGFMYRGLGPEFEKLGDFMSSAGLVCVLKEAARQVKACQ